MTNETTAPSWRPSTILLVALSLSLGWGIRGNFGHEIGAMVPGGLAAIAVCLLSGRPDWRRRVGYFGFFGALGWAFGGSISYMQVIAYTHSGHWPSQLYGFIGLFTIGFLWGGMGGAGTALPAVADRDRLTALFRPMLWVFAVWLVFALFAEPFLERLFARYTETWGRHESPLYWFDADWVPAVTALLALFAYDLHERRFQYVGQLVRFAVTGAVVGFLIQVFLRLTHLTTPLQALLVRYQGDTTLFDRSELVINWPQFVLIIPQHVGWIVGLATGVCLYFYAFNAFKRLHASLYVHMAAGWLIAFIILPTLLGIRMTPPRSDDWAGILGLFIGATIWFWRNGYKPVVFASIVSAVIGGIGFSGMQCLKLAMTALGNPMRVTDPEVIAHWQHWQSANWHSFLEQTYGFVNGIGIAVAMALLATRLPKVTDSPPVRRWTEVFAVVFTMLALTYMNLVKCVGTWVEQGAVPEKMKMPLVQSIELPAVVWFTLIYLLIIAAGTYLMAMHLRRPIALVPPTWLGKGQLFFLVFLWIMVVGNFTRALTAFSAGRILTEGTIFVVGVICTIMILLCPREDEAIAITPTRSWTRLAWTAVVAGILATALAIAVEFTVTRELYGDIHAGHAGNMLRYGPDATWRVSPIRHGKDHL